ncbi:hypothetical protein MVEN_00906500 [Mycena venus]|uniref:PIPK domain-containing protein n=1 Tax=Mycena venus TaxID=2733690 RepID=A0A8H6YHT6_9AGAR|nr:hypothetical protein MVEN_00906500 [Mycena venus]
MTLDVLRIPISLILTCLYRLLRLVFYFLDAMADHKPLPAIPAIPQVAYVPNLTTLSVDAREHRARFIRHILSESDLDDGEDSWAVALEDALDSLSDAVSRGRWLAGVKRGHATRRREPQQRPRQSLSRTDTMSSSASSALQSIMSEETAESIVAFPQSPSVDALRQIRALAAQPAPPNSKPEPKHLLLCMAPLGSRIAIPNEDSSFDLIPANIGCVFKAAVFSLPEDDSDEPSSILYGLAEWDAATEVKLVGGTFAFKGVTSPLQHHALCKVLRISIYMHLSLLLEQHFLSNSCVQLQFPRPKPRLSAVSYQPSLSSPNPTPSSQGELTPRSRQNKTFLPGILSFFSKKNAMHRTHTISSTSSTSTRSGSLDLTSSISSRDSSAPASPAPLPGRLSEDSSRIRRFSFLGAVAAGADSFLKPSPQPSPAPAAPEAAFTAILARLAAAAPLLSSSATVRFAPPALIADLAAKEAAHPGRRLLGDEKVGLGSILGWDQRERDGGREARGKAMVGGAGGLRGCRRSACCFRGMCLRSRHRLRLRQARRARRLRGRRRRLGEEHRLFAPCERPYWTTYQYYSRGAGADGGGDERGGSGADRSLGEMVRTLCMGASAPCGRPGCAFTQGEHVMRLVHGGVRVAVAVAAVQETEAGEEKKDGEKKDKEKEPKKNEKKEKEKDGEKKEGEKKDGAAKEKKDGDAKDKAAAAEGSKISTLTEKEKDATDDDERIDMWVSCAVCGKRTDKTEMNDGAYLFSFAKFLEVLIYSRAIYTLTPALCAHTSPPLEVRVPSSSAKTDTDDPPPPTSLLALQHRAALLLARARTRGIITRKAGDKGTASARTSIASAASGATGTKDDAASVSTKGTTSTGATPVPVDEKRALRKEIKAWWEGPGPNADCVWHTQETTIVGSTLVGFRKALPRLPSVDDAYFDDSASEGGDDDDDDDAENDSTTPKTFRPPNSSANHLVTGLPPSAPTTPQIQRTAQELFPSPSSPPPLARASTDPTSAPPTPSVSASASAPTLPQTGDSLELLTSLRQTFHGAEQALYAQLAQTPVSALNDVRRAFLIVAKGAERRLAAWQKKHLVVPGRAKSKRNREMQQKMEAPEPEWWGKGCHTAPGCNVIVREDDWGEHYCVYDEVCEAFLLGALFLFSSVSTMDYARELASMSLVRASNSSSLAPPTPVLTPAVPSSGSASSFFSAKVAPSNYKQLFTTSSAQAQPDPDQEGAVWYEPEAYSAVISRKEHPRDATSLLSLREVLRQKNPIDGVSGVLPSSSRFGSLGSAATKASSSSGIAPPSAWSKPDVQVSRHEAGGGGERQQRLDGDGGVGGQDIARVGGELGGRRSRIASWIRIRGKAASIISVDSDTTIGKDDDRVSVVEESETANGKSRHQKDGTATTEMPSSPTPTPSSFTNTLTSGISSAMRLLLSNGEIPRPSMFSKNHHGLLGPANVDAFAIDERPHIKYDWTVGKRLKFSCTVYYAKQFDNLRKRCGIDDVFIRSLSRSANWAAEGGKSKSNFWKTADDRFIIKTLVNAWNVADLQVLIELAPSYFRYMDATASRATVLAKLIGFYTIEIRNLETGNVQSKADLLVMENLFYDQKIVKTFDLKGIQGRKVKSAASGTAKDVKTLFDGEWIEGQQRTLTLVRPHSKLVLREALKSDADFLAKSNIMDYSLLLGVDQERKQIACGLVDTIGSYTFAKTLEYKAKQGLNSGKEVTVIPPTEYQDRFVSALEGYFLACPDKWSRSTDEHTKPINDPGMLPSVL